MTAIRRAGAEALDRLEPLWLALHAHHQRVGGERLGPYVDDATSWRERRALYEGFLARDGFAFLAERDGALIGYAMVAVNAASDTQLPDTWPVGERVAEIETLIVDPAARGDGVGSALLDAVDEELARLGIRDVVIAAIATNAGAIRLYERRGFVPASLYLLRRDAA